MMRAMPNTVLVSRFGLVRFGSVQFGSVRRGAVQFGSEPSNQTEPSSHKFPNWFEFAADFAVAAAAGKDFGWAGGRKFELSLLSAIVSDFAVDITVSLIYSEAADIKVLTAFRIIRMVRVVRNVRLLRMFRELWMVVRAFT